MRTRFPASPPRSHERAYDPSPSVGSFVRTRTPLLSLLRASLRAFVWLPFLAVANETPIFLIFPPALAPDGKSFAFEWDDDIWLASTKTGEARKAASTPGRDSFPRISPDGKRLVFTTEENGFAQVVSQPVGGGDLTHHTSHTEGSQLECLSPDGTRALVQGIRHRSGYKPLRLMEIDLTKPSRESLLFDATAHTACYSPDGKSILFCRGGELRYRRRFRGSRATRIWSYQRDTQQFRCEVPGDFEARSPMWLPDGSGFYFVSTESGTGNIWRKIGQQAPEQVTFLTEEELLTPDLSADGSTILGRYGSGLMCIDPEQPKTPRFIEVFTREPLEDRSIENLPIQGCLHVDIGPGNLAVFSEAGELWCTRPDTPQATRLTTSPSADQWPVFLPKTDSLFHISDNGIESSIIRSTFRNESLGEPFALYRCKASVTNLIPSPDGTMIAWIEAYGNLRVMNADGSDPRTVFPCWDKPTFCWSPDSNWLAVAAEDANANRDIHLVSARNQQAPINLTRHPDFDGSPVWSPDGRRIVFTSKRDGTGNAALWCIDFGIGGLGKKTETKWLWDIADQAEPVPTRGIEPRRTLWSEDKDIVFFQSRTKSNTKLYQFDFKTGKMTTAHPSNGIPVRLTADGSLLWRVKRQPALLHGDKTIKYPMDSTFERSRSDHLRLGFRLIWRTLGERFHDPEMDGNDWPAMRGKYEELAARSRTSREFDHVIGRLMGELNASHLVFQRDTWPGEQTAKPPKAITLHPGLFFEAKGDQLAVAKTIPGFPVTKIENPPQPGDIITSIAGKPTDAETLVDRFFTGSPDMRVPVTFRDQNGKERTLSVPCLSHEDARSLDKRNRLEQSRERAAQSGDIAYLPLRSMSRESLERFRLAIHRAAIDSKALILDLRANGGGREANRMLASLTQEIPFITRPRGGPTGYPHDRLPVVPWPHPVAVLCDENTYSNSEIFCHAYLAASRGPLVGTRTAGGVISAVKTDIMGLGKLQIPFRTWQNPESGKSLDLNGAVPTVPVLMKPDDEVVGRDPQLEKAFEMLSQPVE